MAAFLRVVVVVVAFGFQCVALRDEEDDSETALHNSQAQVFSVTESGYFVPHAYTLAGPSSNTNSSMGEHRITKRHVPIALLSVDEILVDRSKKQKKIGGDTKMKPRKRKPNTPPAGNDKGNDKGNGEKGDDKGKGENAGEEHVPKDEEDHPLALNRQQKIMLDVGWLGYAVALGVVFILLEEYWPYNFLSTPEHELAAKEFAIKGDSQASGGNAGSRYVYEAMWGKNEISIYVSWYIAIQAIVNFLMFALDTEVAYLEREGSDSEKFLYLGESLKDWVPKTNFLVQNISAGVIIFFIFARAFGTYAHPVWSRYGAMAPIVFLLADFYTHVEIASVIPTIVDDVTGQDRFMNLTWISLLRTVEMMMRHGSLSTAFAKMGALRDEWILIRMILGYSLLLWVLMSGLFYSENWDNEESEWAAASYNGKKWQRFGSIPSSMWFTMVSLACEWPLADVFDQDHPMARIIALSCAFIGVPLWAVPSGIIGSALQEKVTSLDDEEDDQPQQPDPRMVDNANVQEEAATGEETAAHMAWSIFVFIASFGSVFVFFLWTASTAAAKGQLHKQPELIILWVHIHITDMQLALTDGAVAAIFAFHMGYEVHQRHNQEEYQPYYRTVYFIADLFSWIPGLLHLIVILAGVELPVLAIDLLRGACVFRLLKPDRYIGAFKQWFSIMYEHQLILQATGYVSFMLLVVVSTALYYTEWDNPDGEIREYYGSAARAIWSGLINLHGEWPWADYSAIGKAIGVMVNLAGIAICMIPIAVFADGYADALSIEDEDSSLNRKPWEKMFRPPDEGNMQKIYDLLYSHLHVDYRRFTPSYRCMRALSVSLSILSSVVTIFLTLGRFDDRLQEGKKPQLDDHITLWLGVFYIIDIVCTAFFCFEIFLRIIATKGMYVLSVTGVIDILSIVSLVVSLTPARSESLHPNYISDKLIDDMIVPGRLLRCFCLDNYLHFYHSLATVFLINWKPMLKSFYCLVCLWFMFATCLYFTERPVPGVTEHADPKIDGTHSQDHEESLDEGEKKELTMGDRYSDVLTALQYALVHITGDYPITNYKLQSMPFHLVFVISGMICIGAFSGIFSAGFQNFLEAENNTQRREEAQKRLDSLSGAVIFLQHKFRRMRKNRMAAIGGAEGYGTSQAAPAKVHPFQPIRDLVQRKTDFGNMFMFCCNVALVLNISCVFVNSIEEIHEKVPRTLDSIMASTCFVFFVEYALRLLAARPPFSNVFSFMRVIDLLCLTPAIAEIIKGTIFDSSQAAAKEEYEKWLACLKLLRLVRILDFPIVQREVQRTLKTFRRVADNLLMPAVLGLNIWLFTATVFMWVECKYDGPGKDDMGTVPNAMYYCAFFILGEWANVDFSFGAGSRVCIFYCLVGIMVFAIPVGIISSSVEDSMKSLVEDQKELRRLYGLGKGMILDEKAPPNLGAPMFPSSTMSTGQSGASSSSPPGVNNRENLYMPRFPEQESVLFVPRPPGRLAAPPPVSFEGGNPMGPGSISFNPAMGPGMNQPPAGLLPGMPPMMTQPQFPGSAPGIMPPSGMPGGMPPGMQMSMGGPPFPGSGPPGSFHGLPPPGSIPQSGGGPPGSFHGLPPPGSMPQSGSFHGLPPPGSFHGPPPGGMPGSLQGLPPPSTMGSPGSFHGPPPPLQGLPPPGSMPPPF